jgi:23S rRNA pseudouridine2604 synthase
MKIVLQKFIADSGYCSRRQAENLIRLGLVFVNGEEAELGMRADEKDEVKINGKLVSLNKNKIYLKLNKPIGYTCTSRKFEDEKNVFELLKPSLRAERSNPVKSGNPEIASSTGATGLLTMTSRLFIVGRLDKNSHGLVILTNDGDWAEKMAHPRFEKEKEYIIKLSITNYELRINEILNSFKKGIDIGEGDGVVRAKKIEYLGDNKFKIILTQGKKRQIRRMFTALGYRVLDLKRTKIGNIELGDLGNGKWEYFEI